MSAAVPPKAAKVTTTTPTTTIRKKAINNPHRVQVLVDFPDPTVTIKSVYPIAIPGPQRKFVAVADGDKTFHELKDVINDELHRLYAEEAPYGLCGFKNWQYSKIPERYLIRDVLGKQCDVHATRELLSAKKLGKSTKRKVEGEMPSSLSSSSSSSSSSSAIAVASDATSSSAPVPKAKKAKKEPASPSTETKPKAVVKKGAIATPAIKETAEDKALQAAYTNLTEEQIMSNISGTHTQGKKKAPSGIVTPEASESSASPAPTPAPATPKKQKNAKKVDVVTIPTPAPVPTKAAENEVKKVSATIPFPKDSNDKSEEDIMKEISAYHKAQKLVEETKEPVAVVKAKKEPAKVKKEQAKANKAAATPAGEESSKPTGASAAAKGKKIMNKGYQSDDSSDSAPVTKGHWGARRKDDDVEELQRWAAQDPASLTDEQRNELRLWDRRKYNRDLMTARRRAEINSKSADPVVAAAATLFLDSLNVRGRPGRPSVASESPRKKIEKYIQETSEKKVKDDGDDESEEQERKSSSSSSSSSTPDAEARVKMEQKSIKVEPKPVEREKLPPSMLTEDSDSEEN
ncbi:hypothetical protein KI688_007505 [Linnemannia hyalina]|uniref:Nucleolar protein Dnt1-like N-terminal domain-containing protein n=1 Tax=Linnemannia hyalina TaxID=64524 RepID=A0A9P8BPR3_9FUNG|nr:hypothetical protein KI688_007505 [Linnemannia hyalina]